MDLFEQEGYLEYSIYHYYQWKAAQSQQIEDDEDDRERKRKAMEEEEDRERQILIQKEQEKIRELHEEIDQVTKERERLLQENKKIKNDGDDDIRVNAMELDAEDDDDNNSVDLLTWEPDTSIVVQTSALDESVTHQEPSDLKESSTSDEVHERNSKLLNTNTLDAVDNTAECCTVDNQSNGSQAQQDKLKLTIDNIALTETISNSIEAHEIVESIHHQIPVQPSPTYSSMQKPTSDPSLSVLSSDDNEVKSFIQPNENDNLSVQPHLKLLPFSLHDDQVKSTSLNIAIMSSVGPDELSSNKMPMSGISETAIAMDCDSSNDTKQSIIEVCGNENISDNRTENSIVANHVEIPDPCCDQDSDKSLRKSRFVPDETHLYKQPHTDTDVSKDASEFDVVSSEKVNCIDSNPYHASDSIGTRHTSTSAKNVCILNNGNRIVDEEIASDSYQDHWIRNITNTSSDVVITVDTVNSEPQDRCNRDTEENSTSIVLTEINAAADVQKNTTSQMIKPLVHEEKKISTSTTNELSEKDVIKYFTETFKKSFDEIKNPPNFGKKVSQGVVAESVSVGVSDDKYPQFQLNSQQNEQSALLSIQGNSSLQSHSLVSVNTSLDTHNKNTLSSEETNGIKHEMVPKSANIHGESSADVVVTSTNSSNKDTSYSLAKKDDYNLTNDITTDNAPNLSETTNNPTELRCHKSSDFESGSISDHTSSILKLPNESGSLNVDENDHDKSEVIKNEFSSNATSMANNSSSHDGLKKCIETVTLESPNCVAEQVLSSDATPQNDKVDSTKTITSSQQTRMSDKYRRIMNVIQQEFPDTIRNGLSIKSHFYDPVFFGMVPEVHRRFMGYPQLYNDHCALQRKYRDCMLQLNRRVPRSPNRSSKSNKNGTKIIKVPKAQSECTIAIAKHIPSSSNRKHMTMNHKKTKNSQVDQNNSFSSHPPLTNTVGMPSENEFTKKRKYKDSEVSQTRREEHKTYDKSSDGKERMKASDSVVRKRKYNKRRIEDDVKSISDSNSNRPKISDSNSNRPKISDSSSNRPKISDSNSNRPKISDSNSNRPKVVAPAPVAQSSPGTSPSSPVYESKTLKIVKDESFQEMKSDEFPESYEDRLEMLKIFYRQHGHIQVQTRHNPRLCQWLKTLKEYYLRSQSDPTLLMKRNPKRNQLNHSRIVQLRQLGVEW